MKRRGFMGAMATALVAAQVVVATSKKPKFNIDEKRINFDKMSLADDFDGDTCFDGDSYNSVTEHGRGNLMYMVMVDEDGHLVNKDGNQVINQEDGNCIPWSEAIIDTPTGFVDRTLITHRDGPGWDGPRNDDGIHIKFPNIRRMDTGCMSMLKPNKDVEVCHGVG